MVINGKFPVSIAFFFSLIRKIKVEYTNIIDYMKKIITEHEKIKKIYNLPFLTTKSSDIV